MRRVQSAIITSKGFSMICTVTNALMRAHIFMAKEVLDVQEKQAKS